MNQQPILTTSESPETLALELAALGYPGFAHLRVGLVTRTPAEVVLTALSQPELESRIVEALPWVLLAYPELDWPWLRDQAQRGGLQNRLGFLTNVARRLAIQHGESEKSDRLAREDAA